MLARSLSLPSHSPSPNQLLNLLPHLLRLSKHMPNPLIHPLKSLREPLLPILHPLIHARNPRDLADENRPDPAGEVPRALAVSFGIGLRRVADEDDFFLRQPGVDFRDAVGFVLLCALAEGGDEAAEILPGGVAEDERAGGEVGGSEVAEEGVEVVRARGEVEERGVLELCFEGCVEFGHALDGQRFFDAEGVVQDADWGGGLGYLDRVVDVADDGPAGGLGEVGGAFEDEGGREVFCYGLDLVAGGTGVEAVSMAVFDALG